MQNQRQLLMILIVFLLAGCGFNIIRGSGRVTTETRTVSGFDGVELNGSGDLTITQGDEEALTIEAEDNILPHLRSEVRDGTLVLGADRRSWMEIIRPTQPVRYHLTMREIRVLELSGSGTIQAATLNAEELEIHVNGSGNVTIDQLNADELTYDLSGSGDSSLAGEVTAQQVEISGSGDYGAGDLASQTAAVTISGSGEVTVWVQESLDANISGSGTVSYYGLPTVSSQVSGSGDVISLGDK